VSPGSLSTLEEKDYTSNSHDNEDNDKDKQSNKNNEFDILPPHTLNIFYIGRAQDDHHLALWKFNTPTSTSHYNEDNGNDNYKN